MWSGLRGPLFFLAFFGRAPPGTICKRRESSHEKDHGTDRRTGGPRHRGTGLHPSARLQQMTYAVLEALLEGVRRRELVEEKAGEQDAAQ